MLRLRPAREFRGAALRSFFAGPAGALAGVSTTGAPPTGVEIIPVFAEPSLELCRLLREAANIEHALMVQYLFATFSIKDRYVELAGAPIGGVSSTMLGIAVQEMKHLATVNDLLVALGALPNLDREDFPIRSDIYPFALELEPLSRTSVAKYVVTESARENLDPGTAGDEAERRFRLAIAEATEVQSINHLGSLYTAVIAKIMEATDADPLLLPQREKWIGELEFIRSQGEHAHFGFFRSVFEGTHPAIGNPTAWDNAGSDIYPSRPFSRNPTAFEGSPNSIANPQPRALAWLSNLHYWVVLGLFYISHAEGNRDLIGLARSHMVSCMHPLGVQLAKENVGMPFDALALNYGPGTSADGTRAWTRKMVGELIRFETSVENLLPSDYMSLTAGTTLEFLKD